MLPRLFLTLTAVALPLSIAVAACSVSAGAVTDDTVAGDAGEGPTIPPAATSTDASSPQNVASTPGSPLCGTSGDCPPGATTGSNCFCWPDDDGARALPAGALACVVPIPDGGTAPTVVPDASTSARACRVTSPNAPGPSPGEPSCDDDSADIRGVDGVACDTGKDCAPGFDCVDGDKGAVCRRYCCSGSCDGYSSANGGPTFCDVRAVNRAGVSSGNRPNAPVCMPLKTCTLLQDNDCDEKENCAIVDDKGATSCVPGGNMTAGQSCNTDHCAAGQQLICLGTPGDRTCYTLCRTNGGADCGPNETCTTGSAFQDTSYGVCKANH